MRVNVSPPGEFHTKEQMPYVTLTFNWEEIKQFYRENFEGIEGADADQRREIWPVSHEVAEALTRIFAAVKDNTNA